MSNAILPLVLLGSIGGSVAAVAYGVKTDWEFLGGKDKELEYTPPAQASLMSGSSGDVGSLIVDDFVVTGDEDDMSFLGDEVEDDDTVTPGISTITIAHADLEGDNIAGLTSMPINCPEVEDYGQTALTGFGMDANKKYDYTCAGIENPGKLAFGKVGNYRTQRGKISDLHQSQALCASNQALLGFVLDKNSSGTKAGYRFDCIDLKGPAKVRTALTPYTPYIEDEEGVTAVTAVAASVGPPAVAAVAAVTGVDAKYSADTLKSLNIKCNEDELLQGFATEKSGNNMRYIYRCITPGYEAD
jgi:hypothetical protein